MLAAGGGKRFKSKAPKPLVNINSKPLIIYSLQTLSKHPSVKSIILAVNTKNAHGIKKVLKRYRIGKIKKIVLGGLRRQDSVFNAIMETDKNTDLILIHDAARPFIEKNTVTAVIRQAQNTGAAIVGVPAKATIKKVSEKFIVKETLERRALWEIQTPQVFKKDLILRAYKRFGNGGVTDDSMLVEKLGVKVSVVLGSYNNIKITTPEDLELARRIKNAV